MSKTTLFLENKTIVLSDSNGEKYYNIQDIMSRLHKLRCGTVVKVKNVNCNNTDDKLKNYYLMFGRYNTIRILYNNLRTNTCTVIADSSRDYLGFKQKLTQLQGRLHVLHGDDDRQAYKVVKAARNHFAITDEDKFWLATKAEVVPLKYRNISGDTVQQVWMRLDEAVEMCIGLRTETDKYAVCTEKGTVLFLC